MNPLSHMTPYFVLPIGKQNVDPDQFIDEPHESENRCTTCLQLVRLTSIDGKIYPDINLRRKYYIKGKILPYFIQRDVLKCDFGYGEKAIDPLIKCDIYRMPWTIQNKSLPKEPSKTDEGLKLVLRWMYDVADKDDDLLLRITQVFNQRIGMDLFLFVCSTLNDEPDRYLPTERSSLRSYKLYRKDGQVYIDCQIFGQIRDLANDAKLLPVKFTAIGRYNLTTDQAFQALRFLKLNN